jgi:hypothetical protein
MPCLDRSPFRRFTMLRWAQRIVSWGKGGMPRRPAPEGETKRRKFERLANLRTNLILEDLRKLGSLSNKIIMTTRKMRCGGSSLQ